MLATILVLALQTAPTPDPGAGGEPTVLMGRATIDCRAEPDGRLSDCRVVEETPRGEGFGEAALRSAREARLSPRTVDRAAPASRVRWTTRYTLAPGQDRPPFPFPYPLT